MSSWTTKDRTDILSLGEDGTPKLEIRWANGVKDNYEGDAAIANYRGPEADAWKDANPEVTAFYKTDKPNDIRSRTAYKWGQKAREFMTTPGPIGDIMNNGPIPGAALGGGAGLLGGILANWLSDLYSDHLGGGERGMDYKWLGGAAGAALGAYLGHKRKGLHKEAAMFVDPRNFILEQLQSATDVGMGDRIRLAAAVKNMSRDQAEQLARKVRSALGFGVGAIISRFVGASLGGTLLGGMLGVIGSGALSNLYNSFR